MDPITMIVTAIALGASAGLKTTAEKAVVEGYAGFKAVVVRCWGSAAIERIEREPKSSEVRRDIKQQMASTPDAELLAAAQAMVAAVMKHDPDAARSAGLVEFLKSYLTERGPAPHQSYLSPPRCQSLETVGGKVTVASIYEKFIDQEVELRDTQRITVSGALFPCALLSSGWWDTRGKARLDSVAWNNKVQEWLFHGFDLWGPSWDFSWNFADRDLAKTHPYFIAQLGEGDEANSVPVLIPAAKALKLHDAIQEKMRKPGGWPGFDAEITGILGHRKHFESHLDPAQIEMFGGLLDYCLWLDPDDKTHNIRLLAPQTSVYSGYLWRCLAPADLAEAGTAMLPDCYFVWEHTNFASKDAVDYNLDSLRSKEDYLNRQFGKLVLVQKSSLLVPDAPAWPENDFYQLMRGKSAITI